MYATDFPEIAAGSDFDPTTPPPHSRFIPRAHKTPDLRRGKILLVTNQKITTTNGNSCTSRQPANGALTMFQLIHISSLAFFQCANGVIADVVVLVIFTPFVVDFAADNVSGFVV